MVEKAAAFWLVILVPVGGSLLCYDLFFYELEVGSHLFGIIMYKKCLIRLNDQAWTC